MSPEMLEKYENSSSFKYDILREPITALTMCVHAYDDENKIFTGKEALSQIMLYDSENKQYNYKYDSWRVFEYSQIEKYSIKIKNVLDIIKNSTV